MLAMTSAAYALIGRSHPHETFASLHEASLSARAQRRSRAREERIDVAWRGFRPFTQEPLALPQRLPA